MSSLSHPQRASKNMPFCKSLLDTRFVMTDLIGKDKKGPGNFSPGPYS